MKIKIKVPIFFTNITISDKIDDVFFIEQEKKQAKNAYGQTGFYEGQGVRMYICPNAPEDVLVHECVHAAGMILDSRGIRYSAPPDDETLAYLVGWIYEKIKTKWNKK